MQSGNQPQPAVIEPAPGRASIEWGRVCILFRVEDNWQEGGGGSKDIELLKFQNKANEMLIRKWAHP